jgi:hypothetical protein
MILLNFREINNGFRIFQVVFAPLRPVNPKKKNAWGRVRGFLKREG